MSVLFHLDERLETVDLGVRADVAVDADLPTGDPWTRMAALHEQVAAAAGAETVVVACGDCTARTTVGGLADVVPGGDLFMHPDVDVAPPHPGPARAHRTGAGCAGRRRMGQRSARGWLVA